MVEEKKKKIKTQKRKNFDRKEVKKKQLKIILELQQTTFVRKGLN